MKQPLDFLGVNVYKADAVRRGQDGQPERVPVPPGYPRSAVDWQPLTPSALYWGTKFFFERYKLPIVITENGLATRDQLFLDGKVHDPQRIDYMNRALLELGRAMKEGVPVPGYFAWSILDNFEWADGYKQRFGMVYVDYQSQRRVPKDSYYWYAKVIASQGRSLYHKTAVASDVMTAD
jgi:beta-glucosidase